MPCSPPLFSHTAHSLPGENHVPTGTTSPLTSGFMGKPARPNGNMIRSKSFVSYTPPNAAHVSGRATVSMPISSQ